MHLAIEQPPDLLPPPDLLLPPELILPSEPIPPAGQPVASDFLVPNADASHTTIPLIFGTFFLSGDEFGIEMTDLQEIAPPPVKLQKMPLAPEFVRGLFNLRGRILPVVDLRTLLELQPTPPQPTDIPCMVVLSQEPAVLGILFDAVGEILRFNRGDVLPVSTHNSSAEARHSPVKSILTLDGGERVIQILDLANLLSIRNLPALERRSPERLADKRFVTQRMKDLRREKLLCFTVGDFNLSLQMKCVLAILDNRDTKPSPRKSALCDRVVMFGKQMIPIVSMAGLLGIPVTRPPKRLLVCQLEENRVGFEVEEVNDIMPFSPEKLLPIPILAEYRSSVVAGCFTDQQRGEFIVLNHAGILSRPELVEISVGHHQLSNQSRSAEAQSQKSNVLLLTFRMGKLFGIRLLDVVEVLVAPKNLVRTPSMPPAVLGVVNVRGEPISVVDPRQLLNLEPASIDGLASLLIFRHEGRKVGMLVDSIESILPVPVGPELELPEIFFREQKADLMDSFERGLHVETGGVKTIVLILSADQIVKLLLQALQG